MSHPDRSGIVPSEWTDAREGYNPGMPLTRREFLVRVARGRLRRDVCDNAVAGIAGDSASRCVNDQFA